MKHFVVLTLLFPMLAMASPGPATNDELEAALRDVLSHRDLFDVTYLSDRLGIGLRVHKPQESTGSGDVKRILATATSNPRTMYGRLEYYADIDAKQGLSRVRFSFAPRVCPSLRNLAADRQVKIEGGPATDVVGVYGASFTWPGPDGIRADIITEPSRGDGCWMTLDQTMHRIVSLPASPPPNRRPPSELSRKIGDLLLSGDLRNSTRVSGILDADFLIDPSSLRNGLFYWGNAGLGHVMPDLEPTYTANDTGWIVPAFPQFRGSLHVADRTVDLGLSVDPEVFCLSSTELTSELKKRSAKIRIKDGGSSDDRTYSVSATNLVTLSTEFKDGCLRSAFFHQVTDVANDPGWPVIFRWTDSMDVSSESLSQKALRKVKLLAARLRSVPAGSVQVTEHNAASLARLVAEALVADGIGRTTLRTDGEDNVECFLGLQATDEKPYVCVDAWTAR